MMRILLLLLTLLASPTFSYSQDTDEQLAQYYYSQGEFDKALMYYEKLFAKNESKFNFLRYVECLRETGDNKTAEKVLKKQVNNNKNDQEYAIMLARFYEDTGDPDKAQDIYNELIENLTANSRDVIGLFNAFKAQGKNDLAFQTLEKGRKLLKKTYPLNFQFAEYYGSVGETEKMMNEYIDLLDYHASYMTSLQRILSNQIDFSDTESKEYSILKQALIERTQKDPNNLVYAEMLTWLFIQSQNFQAALVHVKAMDKRSDANGRLIFELGKICVENKDYPTAKKAYSAVIDLGNALPYYYEARNALMNVRFLEVTTSRNFSATELEETIAAYKLTLLELGERKSTLPLILEMTYIQAFYGNKGSEAIEILNKALEIQGLTDIQRAEVKMQLADIHVLHGDIWEASLLYMQVDADFKFETIGHEAKFKNARIFYYDGEFEFAQSQLDVLKQSTSKLISNDAIQLSILITDNYGLDSNYEAMLWFANADLLIEQHRYEEAFVLFDSIIDTYPAHSLGDEIMLKKAHAMELKGQWNEAINYLEQLLKYYSFDILADDALFRLGDIYENHLFDKEKASEYYRKILFEYKGSLYTEEVRKRYQVIRKGLGMDSIDVEQ